MSDKDYPCKAPMLPSLPPTPGFYQAVTVPWENITPQLETVRELSEATMIVASFEGDPARCTPIALLFVPTNGKYCLDCLIEVMAANAQRLASAPRLHTDLSFAVGLLEGIKPMLADAHASDPSAEHYGDGGEEECKVCQALDITQKFLDTINGKSPKGGPDESR